MRILPLISALAFVALAACGHKDSPAAATTSASVATADPNNYLGGNCGDKVVSDYTTLRDYCRSNPGERDDRDHRDGRRDAPSCRDEVGAFLQAYPEINCSASLQDSRSGQVIVKQIDERRVRSLGEQEQPRPGPRPR